MADQGAGDDNDIGVRLTWPRDDLNPRPDSGTMIEAPRDSDFARGTDDDDDGTASSMTRPPLLVTITNKLEEIHATGEAMSARLDLLGSSLAALQSVISDRMSAHFETTAAAARAQSEALEGYRHGNERAVAELRRGMAASHETIREFGAHIAEVAGDTQSILALLQGLTEGGWADGPVAAAHSAGDAGVGDELALLRDEIHQLKRRVGLRARAPVTIDDEQLQAIADQVAARSGGVTLDDHEADRLTEMIVDRLTTMLEVVPDASEAAPANGEFVPPAPPPVPAPSSAPSGDGPKKRSRSRSAGATAAATSESSRRKR
ncbi:MAG: hypothetical protein QOI95_3483 [Acidimicrobiaceae bacterium]|jgi:hypothetical protein